jgi:hypothetical protein
VLIPDMFEQRLLGEDVSGMAHEESQQRELLGGEFQLALTASGPMTGGVEFDLAHPEHR